jgi:hypothetical protein
MKKKFFLLIITVIFTSHLLVSQENSNKIYPQDLNTSNKWWSIFFASVHKKITKKAFEILEKDKNEFPVLVQNSMSLK